MMEGREPGQALFSTANGNLAYREQRRLARPIFREDSCSKDDARMMARRYRNLYPEQCKVMTAAAAARIDDYFDPVDIETQGRAFLHDVLMQVVHCNFQEGTRRVQKYVNKVRADFARYERLKREDLQSDVFTKEEHDLVGYDATLPAALFMLKQQKFQAFTPSSLETRPRSPTAIDTEAAGGQADTTSIPQLQQGQQLHVGSHTASLEEIEPQHNDTQILSTASHHTSITEGSALHSRHPDDRPPVADISTDRELLPKVSRSSSLPVVLHDQRANQTSLPRDRALSGFFRQRNVSSLPRGSRIAARNTSDGPRRQQLALSTENMPLPVEQNVLVPHAASSGYPLYAHNPGYPLPIPYQLASDNFQPSSEVGVHIRSAARIPTYPGRRSHYSSAGSGSSSLDVAHIHPQRSIETSNPSQHQHVSNSFQYSAIEEPENREQKQDLASKLNLDNQQTSFQGTHVRLERSERAGHGPMAGNNSAPSMTPAAMFEASCRRSEAHAHAENEAFFPQLSYVQNLGRTQHSKSQDRSQSSVRQGLQNQRNRGLSVEFPENCTLYVSGLPGHFTAIDVREMLSPVNGLKFTSDPKRLAGKELAHGSVSFHEPWHAVEALSSLPKTHFPAMLGRFLYVRPFEPRSAPPLRIDTSSVAVRPTALHGLAPMSGGPVPPQSNQTGLQQYQGAQGMHPLMRNLIHQSPKSIEEQSATFAETSLGGSRAFELQRAEDNMDKSSKNQSLAAPIEMDSVASTGSPTPTKKKSKKRLNPPKTPRNQSMNLDLSRQTVNSRVVSKEEVHRLELDTAQAAARESSVAKDSTISTKLRSPRTRLPLKVPPDTHATTVDLAHSSKASQMSDLQQQATIAVEPTVAITRKSETEISRRKHTEEQTRRGKTSSVSRRDAKTTGTEDQVIPAVVSPGPSDTHSKPPQLQQNKLEQNADDFPSKVPSKVEKHQTNAGSQTVKKVDTKEQAIDQAQTKSAMVAKDSPVKDHRDQPLASSTTESSIPPTLALATHQTYSANAPLANESTDVRPDLPMTVGSAGGESSAAPMSPITLPTTTLPTEGTTTPDAHNSFAENAGQRDRGASPASSKHYVDSRQLRNKLEAADARVKEASHSEDPVQRVAKGELTLAQNDGPASCGSIQNPDHDDKKPLIHAKDAHHIENTKRADSDSKSPRLTEKRATSFESNKGIRNEGLDQAAQSPAASIKKPESPQVLAHLESITTNAASRRHKDQQERPENRLQGGSIDRNLTPAPVITRKKKQRKIGRTAQEQGDGDDPQETLPVESKNQSPLEPTVATGVNVETPSKDEHDVFHDINSDSAGSNKFRTPPSTPYPKALSSPEVSPMTPPFLTNDHPETLRNIPKPKSKTNRKNNRPGKKKSKSYAKPPIDVNASGFSIVDERSLTPSPRNVLDQHTSAPSETIQPGSIVEILGHSSALQNPGRRDHSAADNTSDSLSGPVVTFSVIKEDTLKAAPEPEYAFEFANWEKRSSSKGGRQPVEAMINPTTARAWRYMGPSLAARGVVERSAISTMAVIEQIGWAIDEHDARLLSGGHQESNRDLLSPKSACSGQEQEGELNFARRVGRARHELRKIVRESIQTALPIKSDVDDAKKRIRFTRESGRALQVLKATQLLKNLQSDSLYRGNAQEMQQCFDDAEKWLFSDLSRLPPNQRKQIHEWEKSNPSLKSNLASFGFEPPETERLFNTITYIDPTYDRNHSRTPTSESKMLEENQPDTSGTSTSVKGRTSAESRNDTSKDFGSDSALLASSLVKDQCKTSDNVKPKVDDVGDPRIDTAISDADIRDDKRREKKTIEEDAKITEIGLQPKIDEFGEAPNSGEWNNDNKINQVNVEEDPQKGDLSSQVVAKAMAKATTEPEQERIQDHIVAEESTNAERVENEPCSSPASSVATRYQRLDQLTSRSPQLAASLARISASVLTSPTSDVSSKIRILPGSWPSTPTHKPRALPTSTTSSPGSQMTFFERPTSPTLAASRGRSIASILSSPSGSWPSTPTGSPRPLPVSTTSSPVSPMTFVERPTTPTLATSRGRSIASIDPTPNLDVSSIQISLDSKPSTPLRQPRAIPTPTTPSPVLSSSQREDIAAILSSPTADVASIARILSDSEPSTSAPMPHALPTRKLSYANALSSPATAPKVFTCDAYEDAWSVKTEEAWGPRSTSNDNEKGDRATVGGSIFSKAKAEEEEEEEEVKVKRYGRGARRSKMGSSVYGLLR